MNYDTDRYYRNWRNTMMTLASLASHAPTAYDLLQRVGLERRRSRATRAAACAGWIGLGMAMGGGLAMLLSPRAGSEVREAIGERARRARAYVASRGEDQDDQRSRASATSRM